MAYNPLPTLGQKTMAGSLPVVLASDQSALPISGADLTTLSGAVRAEDSASADGHVGIGALAIRKNSPGNASGTDGDYEFLQMASGRLWTSTVVDSQLPTGTNTIGGVNIVPGTSGGFSNYHLTTAATTNATVVKASAGHLYGWYIYNSNASARKVAFHNTSTTPTAGASIFFTIVLPPTSAANVFNDTGIAFTAGIAITTVTGLADNNSTAVGVDDLNINLWYK